MQMKQDTFIFSYIGNLIHFLRLRSSSLFIFNECLIYDIFFSLIIFKVKGIKTAQMFFEDCVGPSTSVIYCN